MKTIRFGVIGAGLMGREFASAAARWIHLTDMPARPEIVAICSRGAASMNWFKDRVPTMRQSTTDYHQLLANPDVDAVYIAVPHHLHRQMYCEAIAAGKHVLGEKPFGIDLDACHAIVETATRHPGVLVRCASEFPFFPAIQRIGAMLDAGTFGRILEVNAGFLHSSDMDPNKPINWKRMVEFNGGYGVMGDLGMHVCHVPFRAGFVPINVRAVLSNIVTERPDATGKKVPCTTWDNATLLCQTQAQGADFPMTIKLQRIAPGQQNTWYLEILSTRASVRWSSVDPKRLNMLSYAGGEQIWQSLQVGYTPAFKTLTGGIFEFGFTDAILQMWAAFLFELTAGKPPSRFASLPTPQEALLSHRLFTAALKSHENTAVTPV